MPLAVIVFYIMPTANDAPVSMASTGKKKICVGV